jgi:hypothetical protein
MALAAGTSACAPAEPAAGGFVPDSPEARDALRRALEAWRDAPHPLSRPFDPPGIKFVDQRRLPEQRLREFRILGETLVKSARQFTVRLTLDPSPEPVLVRYNVFGRNPTWVFRLEDYEMISHWEHPMDEPKADGPGRVPIGQPASGTTRR